MRISDWSSDVCSSDLICDGASAVMVVNEKALKAHGITPLARIHHMTVIGHDPVIMPEAPLTATQLALKKSGMKIDDIDLFEVNEDLAPVPPPWLQEPAPSPARFPANGGSNSSGQDSR